MNETKFTPGPWEFTGDWVFASDHKKTPIANFNFHAATEPNGHLIAAAPELYEALEELCRYAEDSDGCQYGTLSTKLVKDIANAALAKARGEA